jgi:hypothetical protein
MVFQGCDLLITYWKDPSAYEPYQGLSEVKPYDNVCGRNLSDFADQLDSTVIPTLTFDQETVWPPEDSAYAAYVMELGKNPGLGIRSLHAQGVTGTGVSVAIIEPWCNSTNPEYADRIVEYHAVGDDPYDAQYSRWTPPSSAALGLLAGESVGTAPGVSVYMVVVSSVNYRDTYLTDALRWIVEKNTTLPAGNKIRVVSCSRTPQGPWNNSWDEREWLSARNRAEQEGILVLDCTQSSALVDACYHDLFSPDSLQLCGIGYPGEPSYLSSGRLYAPASRRTVVNGPDTAGPRYKYVGSAAEMGWVSSGRLWTGVPYLAGVLALGWQLRPDLTKEKMVELAFSSAYRKGNASIINPPTFIDSVRAQ